MKEKITGLGALISAAFASICCLGPIVLVGLGLGGAGLAAGFVKYRPFFLGLTTLFLGIAFYFTYRKKAVTCADGSCELRSGSRRAKAALWGVTALVAALASFPNWSLHLFGKSAPTGIQGETVTLTVSGMDCAACAVDIEKSLRTVPGVRAASVDFRGSEVAVVVEQGRADEEALLGAVKAAGPYTARVKEKGS